MKSIKKIDMPAPKDSIKCKEWKKNLSNSLKGRIPWNKNKRCPQLDGNTNGFKKGICPKNVFKKGHRPWNKNLEGMQIAWNKDLTKKTDERLLKASQKQSLAQKGNQNNKGKHWKVKDTSKMSKAMEKRWQDPEYARKVLYVNSPNKTEIFLLDLLQTIPLNLFVFTGDGKISIGGKYPDFIDEKNKKIIEYNSNYYHSEKRTGEIKEVHEQKRITHFKKFGYNTLVIWESELKNLLELKERILEFNSLQNL